MSEQKKWREWWIEFTKEHNNDKENYKRYVSATEFNPLLPGDEVVKVIEIRALLESQEQVKVCKLAFNIKNKNMRAMESALIEMGYLWDFANNTIIPPGKSYLETQNRLNMAIELIDWLRDGIQHFDDEDQINHLIKAIDAFDDREWITTK